MQTFFDCPGSPVASWGPAWPSCLFSIIQGNLLNVYCTPGYLYLELKFVGCSSYHKRNKCLAAQVLISLKLLYCKKQCQKILYRVNGFEHEVLLVFKGFDCSVFSLFSSTMPSLTILLRNMVLLGLGVFGKEWGQESRACFYTDPLLVPGHSTSCSPLFSALLSLFGNRPVAALSYPVARLN